MTWGPLPPYVMDTPTRGGVFIDIQIFGSATIGGDLYSDNWDGTIPANLATRDSGATAGFYIDGSVGAAQFEGDLFVGGKMDVSDGSNSVIIDPAGYSATNAIVEWGVGADTRNPTIVGSLAGGSAGISVDSGLDGAGTSSNISINEDLISIVVAGSGSTFNSAGFKPAGAVLTIVGTASAPSHSFASDSDTGMYRVGVNVLGLSAGGNPGLHLNSTGGVSLRGASNELRIFSRDNDDQSSVWYNPTGNHMICFINGNKQIITQTQTQFLVGTALAPGLTFIGDLDTGMYRIAANRLGFTAGNQIELELVNGGAHKIHNLAVATGTHLAVDGSNIIKADTSARWSKRKIKPVTQSNVVFNPDLQVVTYYEATTKRGPFTGFVWDDLEDNEIFPDNYFQRNDEGKLAVGPHYCSFAPHLVLGMRELQEELNKLKAQVLELQNG